MMLVGEQPGDQEDLAGAPFVGPAGGCWTRAWSAPAFRRAEIFVTNAVKHFKHEMRGKRRLHKTPDAGEVRACRWWLDAERPAGAAEGGGGAGGDRRARRVRQADAGRQEPRPHLDLDGAPRAWSPTIPSFLLRLPDEAAKKKAFAEFIADLKFAWSLAA